MLLDRREIPTKCLRKIFTKKWLLSHCLEVEENFKIWGTGEETFYSDERAQIRLFLLMGES